MKKLTLNLFEELVACHARMNKSLGHCLSAHHGIGISEFLVLHKLRQSESGSLSRIVLANRVGLTASGVTRLLQPFEKIGLIEKQANARDARQSLVKLSSAGEVALDNAYLSFDESITGIFKQTSHDEQTLFLSVLKKVG
jgi:DNA-binding MarR family transcriptional regulator